MSDELRDVPNRITILTTEEAGQAICAALRTVTEQAGHGLPAARQAAALAVLMAHSAHETGHWHAMHCHNFGNIKAGRRWGGPRCRFEAHEIILGRAVVAPYYWRAYADAEAGALGYCRYLGTDTDGGGNRYQRAWDAALAGDPTAFAHALRVAGYYTDHEAVYTRSMVVLTAGFAAKAAHIAGVADG